MSEQTIQNNLYSKNIFIMDKYECLSLGATTIKNLLDNGVIKKINVSQKTAAKKPDVLILDSLKNVIIYQEHKIPEKFNSDRDIEKTIAQELDAAREVNAKIYVVTDGEKFIWINPLTGERIKDSENQDIIFQIKPKENAKELVKLINEIIISIDSKNNNLLKKDYLDPTDLAQKINGILKNLTFASAKMSLYTFVEVFLFKYLSDISILEDENSFDYIYNLYNKQNNSDAKVLGKYLEGPRETMKVLFPEGKDGTSIINGKVFHAEKDKFNNYISKDNTDMIFKQVIFEFKKYEDQKGKFLNISKDFKSKLFETFMKNSDEKADMGQFFTPLKVVDEMTSMVDINKNMKICDPACGVGKFLLESIEDHIEDYFYLNNNGKLIKEIDLKGYDKMMSEKDDITVILAKANMLIYFSKLFKENNSLDKVQYIANELLNNTYYLSKTMLGTLDEIHENEYDLILANPPYYQSKAMKEEAIKTGQYTLGGAGVEALFLEWILKSLNYGGVANVVLPDGIFFNLSNKNLKKYILDNCFVESIISLPVNTFFNTPKKTYILTIRKKQKKEIENQIKQLYPVFTYVCTSIGETLDTYRFDDENNNDLHEAVCKYNNYKKLDDKINIVEPFRDYFANDKKLKLIDINEFDKDISWIIENWWTEQEKIEIGLKKEKIIVDIDSLKAILNDTANIIDEFMEALECLK